MVDVMHRVGPGVEVSAPLTDGYAEILTPEAMAFLASLHRAFDETGFLERLTGLDKLAEEGEAALEDMEVEWDEDDEDGLM